jgi:protein O-GlcNAc transferase
MATMNPQLQAVLQKAIQAFQGRNFDVADLILRRVLQADSKNLPALHILGLIKASQSNYREAADYLARAARIHPNDASIQYNLAKALSDSGNDKDALAHHKKAVALAPNNPEAWLSYGKSASNLGRYEDALVWYGNALSLKPDYAEASLNKGATLKELERYEEAIAFAEQALSINPNLAVAWTNKGVALKALKRYDEAIAHYDKALSLKPDYHEAWTNKGATLHELKRYDEAIAHYDKALSLKPDYHEAWTNKGATLHELKRYDEAIAFAEQALSINPNLAVAWTNKGVALKALKRYDEAIAHYDKALSLKPDYHEAWTNKGATLHELKRYDEAIAHYDKALSLKPDYHEAWTNKGATLHELKRYDEAIAHYDKALSLKPDYHEAWTNKGATLHELKRYDEAIAHYDKALSLKPDIDWIFGDLLHTKMKICSWPDLAKSLEDISQRVIANEKIVNPFSLFALTDDALLHKKSAEIYIQDRYPSNPILGQIRKRPKNEKIRIAYFSADFKNHPVAFLIAELFELHDRSQFEIYGFSLVKSADEMSGRLELAFDHFIEAQEMFDIEIAQFSRGLNIDIAVDLTGITGSSRTGIFSYQAAPIQVNYLGYPGTLGADYMDYIIADKVLASPELQSCYSEKVIYLPNSYQVNDRKRLISDRQFTRQELGLPENGFIFCCFNNNFKILPATFEGWMRILKAVEGSVLWLFQDNSWAVENLKKEAEKQGIAADRLVFAERLPLPEHLARHCQADLFLDTFPYNAHTTTSDALWTGLPVLTLMGQSFASRVAASLLNTIGLLELITNTQEEYEALAIELALNPKKLADIKLKLANNRLTTPLFDTPLFTKNLESAYIAMVERYHAGLEPDHITFT